MSQSLMAVGPVDGRYADKTKALQNFFSEFALIRYRVRVEIEYFIALVELPLPQLEKFDHGKFEALQKIYESLTAEQAEKIKALERTTNHDVKAVEYFLKNGFERLGLQQYSEFIHFGLTSQDINNVAVPMMIDDAIREVYMPKIKLIVDRLLNFEEAWVEVPMLARTHGQPASPTLLGKEFAVFTERISSQLIQLTLIPASAKFGGATGNFNAHYAAYPSIDWNDFADEFIEERLELKRSYPTTQIEHYDDLAATFDALKRINTILIDLCRDVWQYISMDYFKQKTKEGEVGSSAMPHKVNPIDFENAEGNLGLANALFEHLSAKLPISRLQRDLTDSTVLRNVGVPFAHTLIAFESMIKGMDKLVLNKAALDKDLDANWAVVAEAVQTILRREGYPKPYEALKDLTRGTAGITQETMHAFIDSLKISDAVKEEMKRITPFNYTGYYDPYKDEDLLDNDEDLELDDFELEDDGENDVR